MVSKMGASAFVNQAQIKAKTSRQSAQGLDWVLIGVTVGLTLFGLLMVYSAGMKFAKDLDLATDYFIIR